MIDADHRYRHLRVSRRLLHGKANGEPRIPKANYGPWRCWRLIVQARPLEVYHAEREEPPCSNVADEVQEEL